MARCFLLDYNGFCRYIKHGKWYLPEYNFRHGGEIANQVHRRRGARFKHERYIHLRRSHPLRHVRVQCANVRHLLLYHSALRAARLL